MRLFILQPLPHPSRALAKQAIDEAQDGYQVKLSEPTRREIQSERFHAMCGDIAKSGLTWAGKTRTKDEWKILMVSGHAVATKDGANMVPGLENEFVNLRESTASMGIKRMASLISYTQAWGDGHDVKWSAPDESLA